VADLEARARSLAVAIIDGTSLGITPHCHCVDCEQGAKAAILALCQAVQREAAEGLRKLLPCERDPDADGRFDDTCTDCGAMVMTGEGCEPSEAFSLCWPCATTRLESLTYAIRALPLEDDHE
jgi:hypothetical protein